jgi:hypothetical protein
MDNDVTGPLRVFSATLDKLGAMNLFAINQGDQVLHARLDSTEWELAWTQARAGRHPAVRRRGRPHAAEVTG